MQVQECDATVFNSTTTARKIIIPGRINRFATRKPVDKNQLLLLYLKWKMRIVILSKSDKALVIIIGRSSRKTPYTTHNEMPISRQTNMPKLRSSTLFSLMIFISCGNNDSEVNMPATTPKMEV